MASYSNQKWPFSRIYIYILEANIDAKQHILASSLPDNSLLSYMIYGRNTNIQLNSTFYFISKHAQPCSGRRTKLVVKKEQQTPHLYETRITEENIPLHTCMLKYWEMLVSWTNSTLLADCCPHSLERLVVKEE